MIDQPLKLYTFRAPGPKLVQVYAHFRKTAFYGAVCELDLPDDSRALLDLIDCREVDQIDRSHLTRAYNLAPRAVIDWSEIRNPSSDFDLHEGGGFIDVDDQARTIEYDFDFDEWIAGTVTIIGEWDEYEDDDLDLEPEEDYEDE